MTFDKFSNKMASSIACMAGGAYLGHMFGISGSIIGTTIAGMFGFLAGK